MANAATCSFPGCGCKSIARGLWAEDNIRKRDKTPEQWAEYLEGLNK